MVQGLFPLVVAHGRVTALADGIDLIDEDDAGGFCGGLIEEVAHLGCAHTDKHLYELRPGDGEERNLGLTRYGTCDEGLTRSRRPDEERTFGQPGSHQRILSRMVQEVYDLHQLILRLVLSGHVGKRGLHRVLGIDLGPLFPNCRKLPPPLPETMRLEA